jgi:hypothetical protein
MVILDLHFSKPCGFKACFGAQWAPPFMLHKALNVGLKIIIKTFNKGSLGSRIDEERSKARNVV